MVFFEIPNDPHLYFYLLYLPSLFGVLLGLLRVLEIKYLDVYIVIETLEDLQN